MHPECKHTNAFKSQAERQGINKIYSHLIMDLEFLQAVQLLHTSDFADTWTYIAKRLNIDILSSPALFFRNGSRCFFISWRSNVSYIFKTSLTLKEALDDPLFFQSSLGIICEGDDEGGKTKFTPWGVPYVRYPRSRSMVDILRPASDSAKICKEIITGEDELLLKLQSDPGVRCDCLNSEDPYHPDYQRMDLTLTKMMIGHGVYCRETELEKKVNPYDMDCANCQKVDTTKAFARCSKCRRVRYCSWECQTAHWKNGRHKVKCGRKVSDWWGRAKKMNKSDRKARFGYWSIIFCFRSIL